MPLTTAPITLGDRVWITADVFVAPGVLIGDGAVVTARSSVFHDIEPWTVAGDNSAQAIKPRRLEPGPNHPGAVRHPSLAPEGKRPATGATEA